MNEKSEVDLAIIACSLLADESQPVGASRLDIYDSHEGLSANLGSAPLPDAALHDQENPNNNLENISLTTNIHKTFTKDFNPDPSIYGMDKPTQRSDVESVNCETPWSDPELNNADSINIFCLTNNKILKQNPNSKNSLTGSRKILKKTRDSTLKSDIGNNFQPLPNLSVPSDSVGLERYNVESQHFNSDGDHSEIYTTFGNRDCKKLSCPVDEDQDNKNARNELSTVNDKETPGVIVPSESLTSSLSGSEGCFSESLLKTLSEWDKFYKNFEPDSSNYNAYCEHRHVDAGEIGKPASETAVAMKSAYQHDSVTTCSDINMSNGPVPRSTPRMRINLQQKNDTLKAASDVDNNTFHRSETLPSSMVANKYLCADISSLQTTASPSSQTTASPSSQSVNLGYFVHTKDSEDDEKFNHSSGKLSPSALEFIPRPLAKLYSNSHNHNTAQETTTQESDMIEKLKPHTSSGKNKYGQTKQDKENLKVDAIHPVHHSDKFKFPNPLRSDTTYIKGTSYDVMVSGSTEDQNGIDHSDPLGWNDIFSVCTSQLVDAKPQKSRQAQCSSDDSIQQIPPPSYLPHTFQAVGRKKLKKLRASHPKNNFQTVPSERSEPISTTPDARGLPSERSKHISTTPGTRGLPSERTEHISTTPDAKAVPQMHVHSENEPSLPDSRRGISDSHIPRTQRLEDFPIAARLPPSLAAKAAPVTMPTQVNNFQKNINNIISTTNVHSTLETRPPNSHPVSTQPQLIIKNKLQLRGIKAPAGVNRSYVLEKLPVMIILRGLPGSGKTYMAKQLLADCQQMGVQGVILSTDDYFVTAGKYCYNKNGLPDAHDWNKKRALQCMKESVSPILIDNTNTTLWELLPYAVLALEHSYDVQIFEPETSWRMKLVELARKNSHGVMKEHIKRMKERWEKFTLDDVLKQASHSIAARKSNVMIPASQTAAPVSHTTQQQIPEMINSQIPNVIKINPQKGNAQTPKSSQKNNKPEVLVKPLDKSPKLEITQDFLNQSLKEAMVSLLNRSPAEVKDCENANDFSLNLNMSENKRSNDHIKREIISTERQLSDASWSSDSVTPTVDKDILIFQKKLPDQFDVKDEVQREVVVGTSDISSDLHNKLKQHELMDASSVLNTSCSTSESYHTFHSNSDISSYHTVDDDDDGDILSADVQFDDNVEDVQFIKLYNQETQSPGFNADGSNVTGAEILQTQFERMTLVGDKAIQSSGNYKQHDSENQSVDSVSIFVDTIQDCYIDLTKSADSRQMQSPSSALSYFFDTTVVTSIGDCGNKENPTCASLTIEKSNTRPNICPSSLVEYSDSDDSEKELQLPQSVEVVPAKKLSKLHLSEAISIDKLTDNTFSIVSDNVTIGDQVDATDYIQNYQGTERKFVREISIDRSTQSSEDSVTSSREQSQQIDSQKVPNDLEQKKKKKRIRKGRQQGTFIEDELKMKSKTQNWSTFVLKSSENAASTGESITQESENPRMDTSSSVTQTDPYYFSIVHKLNSPAFNSLQPVECTLSGVEVITSQSSRSSVSERSMLTVNEADTGSFRKIGSKVDQSTITDETLEKEELNRETLQSCFPEYSRKQLEATMAICQNDLEWVTSHLLDSPALYDMEDDEEAMKDEMIKKDSRRLNSAVKSLADMCTTLVRENNEVDADDLEMQVIHVGEDRLQKIERFGRSRLHSFSQEDFGNLDYWPDDFMLEEIPLPLAAQEFKKGHQSYEHGQQTVHKTPPFDLELTRQNSGPLSTFIKEKEMTSLPSCQEKQIPSYPSMAKTKNSSSGSLTDLHHASPSSDVTLTDHQPVTTHKQLIMPLEFVKNLESLFGPLNLQINDEETGLNLDDGVARKIYNCLKLQTSKNVLKISSEQQLKHDEALARALQDEENSTNTNHITVSVTKRHESNKHTAVPGWTGQSPAWMSQGGDKIDGRLTGSINISGKSSNFRPLSVSDTLHHLRGTQGKKVRAHKFQHMMPGAVKSVWYKARWRGQTDSLISIMEEEMAREEQQREQLRIIESTGDMEALATRIKRIELSHLFPSIGPDVLEDIFRSTGYSKEETIRVLQQSYNIPPAPMSKDKEDILNQLKNTQEDIQHVEDFYEDDIASEDSRITYDTLRNEARFCRQLAIDCQQQALRYQSEGMQGAALFYRQRAKKYKEDERRANSRAAQVLFEKGSERLRVENTLDLHFYHLDEAISAVNAAIEMKEDEYKKKPDKRNSYLDIVTGWGRNSRNGIPKLKPAISHHLWTKCFQYEERSAGMLRVYVGKKL